MEFPRRAGFAAEELGYLHAKERRPDGRGRSEVQGVHAQSKRSGASQ
jgi:hypothetical protein